VSLFHGVANIPAKVIPDAKQYGGMYSLKLGTGTAVVLTDRRLIKQLIDKKSNIYSNRPSSLVSYDLITGGDHLLVVQYGNLWWSFWKLIHQYFMESMVEKEHIVLQNAEAVQMTHDYMCYPEEHMRHPKRYSKSIIMSLRKSTIICQSILYVILMAYSSKFCEPPFCCES
jgi:cytochrome P450 family 619